MRPGLNLLIVCFLCLGWPALAEPPRPQAVPAAEPGAHMDYQVYMHGLRIARISAGLELRADTYRIEVAYRTVGLIGWLFRGQQLDIAEGRFGGALPEPSRFHGVGLWRGVPRHVLIEYAEHQPVVRDLDPPNEGEREPVPAALQANTMDPLSAMVFLIRHVVDTGRCDGMVNTFDGRRAVRLTAHTVGETELMPNSRSSFRGRALRCDFEGRLLAGYRLDSPAEDRGKLRHGTAWLAAVVPNAPLLPVRIDLEATSFGDASVYLIAAGPGATRDPEDE